MGEAQASTERLQQITDFKRMSNSSYEEGTAVYCIAQASRMKSRPQFSYNACYSNVTYPRQVFTVQETYYKCNFTDILHQFPYY
jgi:hypothetical protein